MITGVDSPRYMASMKRNLCKAAAVGGKFLVTRPIVWAGLRTAGHIYRNEIEESPYLKTALKTFQRQSYYFQNPVMQTILATMEIGGYAAGIGALFVIGGGMNMLDNPVASGEAVSSIFYSICNFQTSLYSRVGINFMDGLGYIMIVGLISGATGSNRHVIGPQQS